MKAILRSINNFSCKLKQSNNLKYNISPKIRSNKFKNISGNGNVTIEDAITRNLKDYKIYGNTIQKILPDGYTQVDYIKSGGTQYIDTGVNADSNLSIKMNLSSSYHTQQRHMGAIKNDNGVYTRHHITLNASTTTNYIASFTGQTNSAQNLLLTIDDNKHYLNLDIYNKKISADEETPIDLTLQPFDTELNYWLFARNSNNSTNISFAIMQIYDCKMYYSDVLVRDFIPCYRNSDNEVGLYDLVNNVFYTNRGTGSFTYGNVAPTPDAPIDMVSCGDRTKNLIGFEDLPETTSNGVTYSIKDNVFTLNGTATEHIRYIYNNKYYLGNEGDYTLKIDAISGSWTAGIIGLSLRRKSDGEQELYHQVAYNTTNLRMVKAYTQQNIDNTIRIGFYINKNSVFNNFKFRIIYNEGSTSQDYEPYGYKIPVNVRSENLIEDSQDFGGTWNNSQKWETDINDYNGLIVKKNQETWNGINKEIYITPGTYTFSLYAKSDSPRTANIYLGGTLTTANLIPQSKQLNLTTEWARYDITFTSNASGTIKPRLENPTKISNNYTYICGYQLIEGPTAPSKYTPYYNETANIYLDEPLRKIGDYADYIDFVNGKVVRQLGEVVFDGSENWVLANIYNNISQFDYSNNLIKNFSQYVNISLFANYFGTTNQWNNSWTKDNIAFHRVNYNRIRLQTSSITTLEDFKAWLSTHNTIVDYVLATPTEEDIELPNINLIEGKNIITIGTEAQGVFETEYYSKEIIDISNYKYNLRKVED